MLNLRYKISNIVDMSTAHCCLTQKDPCSVLNCNYSESR